MLKTNNEILTEDEILLGDIIELNPVHDAPVKMEFFSKYYEIIVGIGNDHTASILIDENSLEVLKIRRNSIDSQ
jgi:hypothetical protein